MPYPRTSTLIYDELEQLATAHPIWASASSMTRQIGIYHPKFMHIPPAQTDPRPAVLIVSGVHGNERPGPDMVVELADKILTHLDNNTDITIGTYTLAHADLVQIFERIDLILAPLINPLGRDQSLLAGSATTDGRTNGSGVDINRNFCILWKKEDHYDPAFVNDVNSSATAPSGVYRGTAQESEDETKNLRDLMLSPRMTYYYDVHAKTRAPAMILHPWGLDHNTTLAANRTKSWTNPAWDPPAPNQRDGLRGIAYEEYLPAGSETALHDLADKYKAEALKAHGENYTRQQSGPALYATTGASDDWAFSIDEEHMRTFTIEINGLRPNAGDFNDRLEGFITGILGSLEKIAAEHTQPDLRQIQRRARNCTAAIAPGVVMGPGPGTPTPLGVGAGMTAFARFPISFRVRTAILRSGGRLLSPFASMFSSGAFFGAGGFVSIPASSFSVPAAPSPTTSPPVHAMRLTPISGTAGDTIRGTLLDQSLDFTQIVQSQFRGQMTLVWASGPVAGAITWILQNIRFLGPQELEFDVPPVQPALGGIPLGQYQPLFLYHPFGWSVNGVQDFRVT